MYLDFFKLKQLPFRMTADPGFHFENAQRAEAKKKLLAALTEAPPGGEGCVWVSGEAGIGKTILVQDALEQLRDRFAVVQIRQAEISIAEFHEAIITVLGPKTPVQAGAGSVADLNACLAEHAKSGRRVLLFLDNGEVLSADLLDEILRMPWRSETTQRILRIVLAARPSLGNTLRKPRFDGYASRLGLRIELLPLTMDETRGYLEHRLTVAGRAGGGIFAEDVLAEIQRYTGGVPRLINTLADAALMAAFNRDHSSISAFDIRGAAKQLQWVEYDARANRHERPTADADEGSIGHIRIEHQGATVAEFDLPLGKITMGRSPSNDVAIESRFVSRNHCRVVTTAHYSVIEDLQSQNGLMVDSRRVSVHRLHHGDRVQMGEHILVYSRLPSRGRSSVETFPLRLGGASSIGSDTGQTGLIASIPTPKEPKDG
jgi:type II secretory pathway predicted ATPase ExeA